MTGRLRRYYKCGAWFGKICCCITAVDWMYWRFLEWWLPRDSIDIAPELPPADAARCKTEE
jgi:phosphatidylinositol glycan class A protein